MLVNRHAVSFETDLFLATTGKIAGAIWIICKDWASNMTYVESVSRHVTLTVSTLTSLTFNDFTHVQNLLSVENNAWMAIKR